MDVINQLQADFPKKMPTFEPTVRYTGFADYSVTLNATLRAKEFEFQYEIKHEFIKRLHKRLAREGIQIPFPTREIKVSSGGVLPPADVLE